MFGSSERSLSDNDVIQEILSWNSSAFEIIYERYSKQLYNYILTLLNFNTDEAGLVLSDVFIKVYDYLQKKDIDNLKSLLFKIAHNTAVDWIRAHQHQDRHLPRELETYVDPKDLIRKGALNTAYKKQLMADCLSKLDEKYRSVIYLLYYEGKSYDDIAVIQQSNKNSIGTIAFQWKKKLEEIIKKSGLDPNIFLL